MAVEHAGERLRQVLRLLPAAAQVDGAVELAGHQLVLGAEREQVFQPDVLQLRHDMERLVGMSELQLGPVRRDGAAEGLDLRGGHLDVVLHHGHFRDDVGDGLLLHRQLVDLHLGMAGEAGEGGRIDWLALLLLLRALHQQLVEIEVRAGELEIEFLRRLRPRSLHLHEAVALHLVVEQVGLHIGQLDPLLRIGAGTVGAARTLERNVEPISGLLVHALPRPQIDARQIELCVELERTAARRRALEVRSQRHRRSRLLGQLLRHRHLHRREVELQLQGLCRLRAARPQSQPDGPGQHVTQRLAQRRVVGGEPRRIQVV